MWEKNSRMLFDKNLFESKYVPAEQRTPVDTLILIGNGFDIWQNLDTSYRSFERQSYLPSVFPCIRLPLIIWQAVPAVRITDPGRTGQLHFSR